MRLFIAVVALLVILIGIAAYVFYPAGEFAWMDSTYQDYRKTHFRLSYKALAIDRAKKVYGRAVSFPGPEAAIAQAFYNCRKKADHCEIYALGNTIAVGDSRQAIINLSETYWAKHAARIFSSPWKGTVFKGSQIKPALEGMTAYGVTRNGLRIRVEWLKTGKMTARVLNNFTNPPRDDQGRWWVQDGQLCRQYDHWYAAQRLCGNLAVDGDEYLIYTRRGQLMVIFKQVGDRAAAP